MKAAFHVGTPFLFFVLDPRSHYASQKARYWTD
jgi:hypothetical protein